MDADSECAFAHRHISTVADGKADVCAVPLHAVMADVCSFGRMRAYLPCSYATEEFLGTTVGFVQQQRLSYILWSSCGLQV